ncbi:hypothetical protein IEQ34_016706 [Dendrobium chrysotoxum]|uniref:Uncharacterized protein n=1 Tax=Dendrobium chrysotoxum TaxID=161865 RepID=A0AAV7GEZ7_DENCH|nr:hypothetical protein IEQ34_016706 [Dendrobium chrysotoxum]
MQFLSLMQMWMESEAEAKLCPMPHTSMAVTSPNTTVDEPSARLDACKESKFFEEIIGNVRTAALFPSLALLRAPSLAPYTGNALKLIGRHEMEDFILQLEEERRREVSALGELHPVSRFPFLGRIQVIIG